MGMVNDLSRVLSDLRSNYIKCRNGLRSKSDSMELLSYKESGSSRFQLKSYLLETYDSPEIARRCFDVLRLKYLIVYRDSFICSNDRLFQSLDNLVEPVVKEVPLVVEESKPSELSSIERRRLAQKKYNETHRESQRLKYKNYYERNREKILERLALKRSGAI